MNPLLMLGALLLLNSLPAYAQRTPDITGVAYKQKLGARLPSESAFTDADGHDIRIGDVFNGAPVILVLGYFHCDKLCGVTRLALLRAAQKAGLSAGSDYVFVAISIDPLEKADAARQAREIDFAAAAPIGATEGFRYLTGTPESIRAVAEAVGYSYHNGARSQTFIHPIGAVVVTTRGFVSSYLSGIGSSHDEIRGALEAAATQSAAPRASPTLLLCLDFDSTTGRYTFAVMKFLRIGAVGMALALAGMIYREFRKGARA
ncbi:SCO family protein [Methylocystis sp. L43]|jgi:protein SCO1/2|uniref:SCO family protein n=1 Tax=unclassified Methylocystis TaxID=2625913 RepID=UPI0018C31A91|nr:MULTISPECIES: SCO family protein [unclassified Methylocystis]MBG0797799.1 SCO family protein [Methylocystis sp. L43]MBG0806033.1 SCO family protein [Methylocystis sp. H15]